MRTTMNGWMDGWMEDYFDFTPFLVYRLNTFFRSFDFMPLFLEVSTLYHL